MPSRTKTRWLSTTLLLIALVLVFAFSFVLAPKEGAEDGTAFAGTDSKVTTILEEHGVEPWFQPLFSPGSGEIESGLFALQAAIGAGILGFAVGALFGRRTKEPAATSAERAPTDSG